MKRTSFLLCLLLLVVSCAKQPPRDTHVPASGDRQHPVVDFSKWCKRFPIETFEKKEGPRQYTTTEEGDPLDLWKAHGTIVTSPADLCQMELVRERVRKKHDLGRAVPADVFIWRKGAPDKPYLTKLGGVPHREKALQWPTDQKGNPYTFVAQFCFLDSKDIVSGKLPGDVMLVFFKDSESHFGEPEDVRIEWSSQSLREAMTKADCPAPRFPVPELAGEIHRCNEYPDSSDAFDQEGHANSYLFATSQSTKIGREASIIQNDPRENGQEFICTLNSIMPSQEWPFTNMEALPADPMESEEHHGWGAYQMMFGDVGCMYFMIDAKGNVSWASACS